MIDISAAVQTVIQKLEKCSVGHCMDLRTYKRNRSVVIVKRSGDLFEFIENGFFRDRFQVRKDKLRKTLKSLLKKEFPRSNKLRLYQLGKFEEEKIRQNNLKKL